MSDRGLARRILTRRGYVAITFGHVIVSTVPLGPALFQHELCHVRQYERIGLAFLPLYLRLLARYGYIAHPLERDAAGDRTLFV